MSPDEYCRQKAARSGSSFYYSFFFLPDEKRRAMIALYAFCRHVDDVVDDATHIEAAQKQLEWWFTEIDRLYHGEPQHPITKALAPFVSQFNWPMQYFVTILQGMQMDLMEYSYQTFDDLLGYCYHVAGVVGLLSTHVFGYQHTDTLQFAKHLGTTLQLINIIRDLGEDLQLGRVYIPADLLTEYGLDAQTLGEADKQTERQALLGYLATQARSYYEQALACLSPTDRPDQKSSLIMAKVYLTLLDEMEKDQFQVLNQRYSLTPVRKCWIAWRTARNEKKQSRQQQLATA